MLKQYEMFEDEDKFMIVTGKQDWCLSEYLKIVPRGSSKSQRTPILSDSLSYVLSFSPALLQNSDFAFSINNYYSE